MKYLLVGFLIIGCICLLCVICSFCKWYRNQKTLKMNMCGPCGIEYDKKGKVKVKPEKHLINNGKERRYPDNLGERGTPW